jgi:hypothetical protein
MPIVARREEKQKFDEAIKRLDKPTFEDMDLEAALAWLDANVPTAQSALIRGIVVKLYQLEHRLDEMEADS